MSDQKPPIVTTVTGGEVPRLGWVCRPHPTLPKARFLIPPGSDQRLSSPEGLGLFPSWTVTSVSAFCPLPSNPALRVCFPSSSTTDPLPCSLLEPCQLAGSPPEAGLTHPEVPPLVQLQLCPHPAHLPPGTTSEQPLVLCTCHLGNNGQFLLSSYCMPSVTKAPANAHFTDREAEARRE